MPAAMVFPAGAPDDDAPAVPSPATDLAAMAPARPGAAVRPATGAAPDAATPVGEPDDADALASGRRPAPTAATVPALRRTLLTDPARF
jgi:hypothetical protein